MFDSLPFLADSANNYFYNFNFPPIPVLGWCTSASNKVHPRTGHEDPEVEYRYSSTLTLTSALYGNGCSRPPAALPPGKIPDTLCIGGLVGPRACMDGCGKFCLPPGFDPRTVQPVASRYNDWAIPAPLRQIQKQILTCAVCIAVSWSKFKLLPVTGQQQLGCIIPQAVKHSLALLRMGKKLPETCWADWILINCYCCI